MGLLLLVFWIVSAVAGWFAWHWWLVVPPLWMLLFVIYRTEYAVQAGQKIGLSMNRYRASMFGPNAILVLHNTVLNAAIYGVSWAIRTYLVGP
jgi:hypothetical protein